MKVETLKNQLLEVVNNGVKPTPELLKAIELCEGDDEFILGAKEYLRDFGPKELSDIKSMIPNFRSLISQEDSLFIRLRLFL